MWYTVVTKEAHRMETMLIIKMGIFVALEVFVVGTIGAVLILGLREIVEFRIKSDRKRDKVAEIATFVSES
jgi:hypothetical protein